DWIESYDKTLIDRCPVLFCTIILLKTVNEYLSEQQMY
ncbi:MAG: hypothetical protein ACI90V_011518, partial [Bacillariaceae sp.]